MPPTFRWWIVACSVNGMSGAGIDAVTLAGGDLRLLRGTSITHRRQHRRRHRHGARQQRRDACDTHRTIVAGDQCGGMRELLMQLRPDTFEDVIAVLPCRAS